MKTARSLDERIAAANDWMASLQPKTAYYADSTKDETRLAFAAYPERLYVLAGDGTVVYQGGPGPFNYNMDELATWLKHFRADGSDAQKGTEAGAGDVQLELKKQ